MRFRPLARSLGTNIERRRQYRISPREENLLRVVVSGRLTEFLEFSTIKLNMRLGFWITSIPVVWVYLAIRYVVLTLTSDVYFLAEYLSPQFFFRIWLWAIFIFVYSIAIQTPERVFGIEDIVLYVQVVGYVLEDLSKVSGFAYHCSILPHLTPSFRRSTK